METFRTIICKTKQEMRE